MLYCNYLRLLVFSSSGHGLQQKLHLLKKMGVVINLQYEQT